MVAVVVGLNRRGANLNISTAGEALQFAPAALNATAGQQVKVTFKNGSAAQKHNWVLVKGGDAEAQKVDDEGAAAGEAAGYIPTDPNIIASVKLLNGGETRYYHICRTCGRQLHLPVYLPRPLCRRHEGHADGQVAIPRFERIQPRRGSVVGLCFAPRLDRFGRGWRVDTQWQDVYEAAPHLQLSPSSLR